MALKIFKRKKEKPPKIEAEKEIQEEKKVKEKIKREEKKEPQKITEAWRYIIAPHITEKATTLSEKNRYVFEVSKDANKTEIKKAIEGLYGVEVEKVRIIKMPRKRRRRGRIEGWKKGYKKAIVKVKEGQKIEILPR